WLADEQAPPDDDRVQAFRIDARLRDEAHHPERRTGPQTGRAREEPTLAHRVETVDVLVRVDALDDLLRVETRRQRELHQDAVHVAPAVQVVDEREQLGLRRRRRQPEAEEGDAERAARLLLVADVDRGRRVVADEDGRETGSRTARAQLVDAHAHLLAHAGRDRLAVDHARPPRLVLRHRRAAYRPAPGLSSRPTVRASARAVIRCARG